MARRKRSSQILEKAERRIAGVQSIDPNLNLGNGLSAQAFADLIEETRNQLKSYNTALSVMDQTDSALDKLERSLADFTARMLGAVGSVYGKDSDEYEMAGGSRQSDRRKARKVTPTPEVSSEFTLAATPQIALESAAVPENGRKKSVG